MGRRSEETWGWLAKIRAVSALTVPWIAQEHRRSVDYVPEATKEPMLSLAVTAATEGLIRPSHENHHIQ